MLRLPYKPSVPARNHAHPASLFLLHHFYYVQPTSQYTNQSRATISYYTPPEVWRVQCRLLTRHISLSCVIASYSTMLHYRELGVLLRRTVGRGGVGRGCTMALLLGLTASAHGGAGGVPKPTPRQLQWSEMEIAG